MLCKRPDIVICTPGRMLDHMRNSPSIHCDDVDVLVGVRACTRVHVCVRGEGGCS